MLWFGPAHFRIQGGQPECDIDRSRSRTGFLLSNIGFRIYLYIFTFVTVVPALTIHSAWVSGCPGGSGGGRGSRRGNMEKVSPQPSDFGRADLGCP